METLVAVCRQFDAVLAARNGKEIAVAVTEIYRLADGAGYSCRELTPALLRLVDLALSRLDTADASSRTAVEQAFALHPS